MSKRKPFTDADAGAALRAARLGANVTQQGLADMTNVTAQAVAKWEKGRSSLTAPRIVQIARALKISPRDLVPAR